MDEPEEVRAARAVMETHYKERVAPVSEFCAGVFQYMRALVENHLEPNENGDIRDDALHEMAKVWSNMGTEIMIHKSNLLWRLLYLGLPLRTKKCPEHDGQWSGCPFPGDECPHGCTVAGNTTGWIE